MINSVNYDPSKSVSWKVPETVLSHLNTIYKIKNRSAMRTWGLMLSLLHSALIEFGIAVSLLSCVIKNLP